MGDFAKITHLDSSWPACPLRARSAGTYPLASTRLWPIPA